MTNRFAAAADALSSIDADDGDLAAPFVDALHVTGASISTIGEPFGTETLSATDPVIARVDELQFDLGEGPCWDALASGRPVLVGDVRRLPPTRWPHFLPSIAEQDAVAAVFAFPLLLGPLKIGAIDLYSVQTRDLAADETEATTALADIVSRHVLRRALGRAARDEEAGDGRFSRRAVHQATGMVIAQLGVSAEDARLLIHGHAFAEGRSVQEVADDILERRFSFTVERNKIEDSR